MSQLTCSAIPGLPLVEPGQALAPMIVAALEAASFGLLAGDILVLAQKIVSKAQDRYLDLAAVVPGVKARELAGIVGRDPRYVEAVLGESRAVVKAAPNLLVVEDRNGLVMANAGIDQSNIAQQDGAERVLLLPLDPDGAAAQLRLEIAELTGVAPGIIIGDTFGRPWRLGVTGVAIGVAGLPAIADLAGQPDLFGRPLQHTQVAIADELAAAASLLMGQAAEGCPLVHIRGFASNAPERPAAALLRPRSEDRFR